MMNKTIVLMGLAFSLSANAAPISISVLGSIVQTSIYGEAPVPISDQLVGQSIEINFVFDSSDLMPTLHDSEGGYAVSGRPIDSLQSFDVSYSGHTYSSKDYIAAPDEVRHALFRVNEGGETSDAITISLMEFVDEDTVNTFEMEVMYGVEELVNPLYLIDGNRTIEITGDAYGHFSVGTMGYWFTDNGNTATSGAEDHAGFYFQLDQINITAVPVPAAVWLFGSSLLGLAAIKRRK